jgi:carboxyl-terminal processing protease
VRFNIFLPPLMGEIRSAVRSFEDAPAVVVDLRGNPGGVGAMAPAIAALFLPDASTLGTMKMRRGEVRFVTYKQPAPYAGLLVVLVDEASASTSEIFAGALQESGRAAVVGQPSLGAVLPSIIEKLPNGAIFQYAVADFKTPKGVLLEGRGVLPDVAVPLERAAFLAGRDPTLDAALRYVESHTKEQKGTASR